MLRPAQSVAGYARSRDVFDGSRAHPPRGALSEETNSVAPGHHSDLVSQCLSAEVRGQIWAAVTLFREAASQVFPRVLISIVLASGLAFRPSLERRLALLPKPSFGLLLVQCLAPRWSVSQAAAAARAVDGAMQTWIGRVLRRCIRPERRIAKAEQGGTTWSNLCVQHDLSAYKRDCHRAAAA